MKALSDAAACVEQLDTDNHDIAARALRDCFIVIGEATGTLPAEVQEAHPEVPWAKIKGMRNIGTHEYFKFSLEIAKAAVHVHFPALRAAVEDISRNT